MPWSQEAEEATVGSLLIDPGLRGAVQDILSPDDFHDERLQAAIAAMFSMDGLNPVTLADRIGKPELASYILGLINCTPTAVHAEHYARIVHRDAVRRRAIQVGGDIAAKAYQTPDCDEVVAFANRSVAGLSVAGKDSRRVDQIASQVYDQVEAWAKTPGAVRGVPTGFASLDGMTGGLEAGQLVVLAGRPAMGKSSLSFEIAFRAARQGRHVQIFSLEMTGDAVVKRWASSLSGIPTREIKAGKGDLAAYIHAIMRISEIRTLWIDDTPGLSPSQVRARSMKRMRESGIDLVVVDHGRLLALPTNGENTSKTEGKKSQAMKDLAKDLACPVLLCLQLNRGVEDRANKQPGLSDLRDTGEHEENADVVLGLYRDEYYDPGCPDKGIMEVIALKQRDGPTGTIKLGYDPETQRFTDGMRTTKIEAL